MIIAPMQRPASTTRITCPPGMFTSTSASKAPHATVHIAQRGSALAPAQGLGTSSRVRMEGGRGMFLAQVVVRDPASLSCWGLDIAPSWPVSAVGSTEPPR